jgi:N-acetylated-alpha-linked acidic dipeptidase
VRRSHRGRWSILVAASLVLPEPGFAQTGFTAAGAVAERAAEEAVLAAIVPAELDAMARTLAMRPHIAGTPEQAALADTLAAWLRAWGLRPETPRYDVFMPHATAVSLALVAPEFTSFTLDEPAIPGDSATAYSQYPWANGYSAPGAIEADVVYVNYGLTADYALLDSLGIDVAGRVVLARYGRSFRGVKARLAAERGALGIVLYSDPLDDGYVQGDLYPKGPFRPWRGIQRGSVLEGTGDPATPAGPSTTGAPRIAPASVPIPSVPISYEVAAVILERLEGADVPEQEWQGGLPFRYHVGPGPARLRVTVDDDRDGPLGGVKEVRDVLARIDGRELPDEWVLLGAHIDAWGPGAADNVSGTVSVWGAARALARLAAEGRGPRRTVIFAGWDGEEWGLIGSTEWVEEHAAELAARAVAYLNQDGAGGTRFGAAASPSLKSLLREGTAAIPAGPGRSLLDEWREETRRDPPPIGDLGGGSDFAPFYNHLGIPSANHGFGTPGGVYHSHYDTHRWMAAFGDPGYVHHALTAELLAVLALRLANAEVLPYDYATFGEEMGTRWRALRDSAGRAGILDRDAADPLGDALAELAAEGVRFAQARDRYLAAPVDPARSRAANHALLAVERELTRPEGLVGRPWYRNLVFASDRRNGYSTLVLPSISEAIVAGDLVRVRAEIDDLAARVRRAAARVREAGDALTP